MPSTPTSVLAGVITAVSTAALTLSAQPAAPAAAQERAPAKCAAPSDVLDLSDWKLTLPTGEDEDPTEITQPQLKGFSASPWFRVSGNCEAVRFRAAVNGVTTGGSSYPRAELREMTEGGEDEAEWSTTEGTHTLVVDEAFMALPKEKPQVVGAQVHGGDDDVTVFRLDGSRLYITDGDDSRHHLVTDDYELGTEFEAKFVAQNGEIDVYYNGELETTISHDGDTNYFKAGAYTQANCGNSAPCSSKNYGEVRISDIKVTHS
ncbi:polysaccharide lyase family 7 protein [Streptomyces sp. NBC_00445]|uniref:polysaccharide lyase family 7 protein n=1 Tax=unclassified Streptomyces TaxID=2593676 RepID=UPI002E240FB8|nr:MULTISPECIES: polysaccharide lyase family 7 protein [unclassified Streptomyces]